MRACEGCRRRKIKCDAATTNTWPCSACVRLKLHCVRPNGFDGSTDSQVYEPVRSQFDAPHVAGNFRQQQLPLQEQPLLAHAPKPAPIYPPPTSYQQDAAGLYHAVQYTEPQSVPHDHLQYAPVHHSPVAVVDQHQHQHQHQPQPQQQQYTAQASAFPTPPLQHAPHPGSPAETFHSDYAQQDLADLLGSLKVNEAGTGNAPRATRVLPRF